jgi:hypothetical protein
MPEGRDLPFFLGGDARRPVYLLRWRSDRDGIEEAAGRGLDRVDPLPAGGTVSAAAEFDRGEWRLMVRRPLAGGTGSPALPRGEAIPVAFFARDGSSGETGHRGAVSSWYFLYLDQPVAAGVYVWPVAAALLTALLGLVVVTRAQRAERRVSVERTETQLEGV